MSWGMLYELSLKLRSYDVPPKYEIIYIQNMVEIDRKEGEIKYLKSKSKLDNEKKLFEAAVPILNAWYDSLPNKQWIIIRIYCSSYGFINIYKWGKQNINGYTYEFEMDHDLIHRIEKKEVEEKPLLKPEPEPKFKTVILLEL